MTTARAHTNGIRKHKNGAASRSTSHATSHIGGVIDGAEALVAATADMGEDKLVDIRKSLQADLESAREHLEALESGLKNQVTGVDDYVHENPWQAIGVAAAAGVLVGAIAFRR